MLNAVGIVDTGRISTDTAHLFRGTKDAGSGIAARFYMHRNFFVNDPDAFNTTAQTLGEFRELPPSLALNAAQASIALSAVSGGMFEIGDDMLALGAQKDRLALVENPDLLGMAKLGRASTPVDLMTFEPEDEQPSVFFLRESPRQAVLTVFNWTKTSRSHTLKLADLGLPADHKFAVTEVLRSEASVNLASGAVRIGNQAPESVEMIKLVDEAVPQTAPSFEARVPSAAKAGETLQLSVESEAADFPATTYRWDFGEGTSADGRNVSHAYTRAGDFTIRVTATGVDGLPADRQFKVAVTGNLKALPNLSENRRFADPTDH